MNADKGKWKRRGIFLLSLVLHGLIIYFLAFPIFKVNDQSELLYSGFLVQFDTPTIPITDSRPERTASKTKRRNNPDTNPYKKAAETKSETPKFITQSDQKIERKHLKPKKDTKVLNEPINREQNTDSEKRRKYVLNQLAKKTRAEIEAEILQEKQARIEKYEKMKNAFSQILENANNETSTPGDIDLSHEMLPEQGLGRASSTMDEDLEGLSNRKVLFQPEIQDHSYKQGRVVINICVNAEGDVTSARYTQKGSTTTDAYLIELAEKSALLYKFSRSTVPKQCGIVNIVFMLQ